MKNILFKILLVVILIGSIKVLALVDESNYKKAIDNCGSQDNIITNYDSTGDKYYTCKK